jgi:hypothetical protein
MKPMCGRQDDRKRSAARALRKLRADRPDIHARVLAGELSPHESKRHKPPSGIIENVRDHRSKACWLQALCFATAGAGGSETRPWQAWRQAAVGDFGRGRISAKMDF